MSKACSLCKKPVSGQYYRAKGLRFHPQCFICFHCQKPLGEGFTLQQGHIYHLDCYKASAGLVCAHCQGILEQTWQEFQGKKYHPQCFGPGTQLHCGICGKYINQDYTQDKEGVYHSACYTAHKLPQCSLCQTGIQGKYLYDLWGNQAHPSHGGQKTQICHICGRIIGEKTSQNGIQYGDGRITCGICRLTEMGDPAQMEIAKQRVIQQLQEVGFEYIPNYIAVSLADQHTINQRLGQSKHSNTHGYTKTLKKNLPQGIVMEHSIFILYGLPRLVYEGVLAHELLHVWLNERALHDLPEAEVEGFCNLGTALIYQNDATLLAHVLLQRMEEDQSPIYGEGYRKLRKRCQKLGWQGLIAEIQTRPNSPLQRLNRWVDRWI